MPDTHPSSDVLERVARALYAARPFSVASTATTFGHQIASTFDWDGAPAYYQEDMRQLARAAIAAMPTIERLSAELALTDANVIRLAELNPLYANGEHIALNIRIHVRAILTALSDTKAG